MTPESIESDLREKVFTVVLKAQDIDNLVSLMQHENESGAAVMRAALRLYVYFLGIRTAAELSFYPPAFRGKKE